MNRRLTLQQNIALVVISIILLGVLYYFAVWETTSKTMETYDVTQLEDQLLTVQVKAQRMLQMEKVNEENADRTTGLVAGYNNLQNEIVELNRILGNADSYQINFEDATVDGGTVRRNISISFASSSYDRAKEILQLLQNGKYKCLLRNIQMTAMDSGLEQTSQVRVSLSVTFYEYVVDSKAVEGLQKYVDPNATSTTSE